MNPKKLRESIEKNNDDDLRGFLKTGIEGSMKDFIEESIDSNLIKNREIYINQKTPTFEDDNVQEFDKKMSFEDARKKYEHSNPKITKAMDLFYKTLNSNIDDVVCEKLFFLSNKIAKEIDDKNNLDFPKIVRSKVHCLKTNKKLCIAIYLGEVKPDEFVRMTDDETKSEEIKLKDQKLIEKSINDAIKPTMEAETDMFLCSNCNQRKTTYRQQQTRSCDEPMTTFVTCTVCKKTWKF
ncbi:TCEA1 [Hepatospora eriocheir]|uniref:TCEA1 n=1 Tax=Hepatospora eriocheir TaxID=1081669 RepID=A0A1X0QA76_9MICR|nr:TCEA1 [Hepatospora eriocheir]